MSLQSCVSKRIIMEAKEARRKALVAFNDIVVTSEDEAYFANILGISEKKCHELLSSMKPE